MTSPGSKLRELIARPNLVEAIGVHDAISARLVEQAGFECVYAGGSAAGLATFAIPDLGIITMSELVEHMRHVSAAVSVPVIADLDDGGGNPVRVRRTVRNAIAAGVAGFHIEDTDFSGGKHFAAADGSGLDLSRDSLRPAKDFVHCVTAAVEARGDDDTVIIARTDAAMHSVDEAIDRAGLYSEAGADMVFLCWLTLPDVARVTAAVKTPLLYLHHDPSAAELDQLEADGASLVFRPSLTWTVGFKAVHDALAEIRRTRELQGFEGRKAVPTTRFDAVKADEWGDFARRHGMMD